jgi:hypothetical protein
MMFRAAVRTAVSSEVRDQETSTLITGAVSGRKDVGLWWELEGERHTIQRAVFV